MTQEVRLLRSNTAKPLILVEALNDAATSIPGHPHRLVFAVEKWARGGEQYQQEERLSGMPKIAAPNPLGERDNIATRTLCQRIKPAFAIVRHDDNFTCSAAIFRRARTPRMEFSCDYVPSDQIPKH